MTEVGEVYYRHCVAMIAEAEAAQEAIDNTSAEPRGMIRVTCPISLMFSSVAPIISRYLAAHPQVRVQLSATNRRVDVIEEGVDVALRVRFPPLENEGLVMKRLAESRQLLVGSAALLDQLGRPGTPAELSRLPALDLLRSPPKHAWECQSAGKRDPGSASKKDPLYPRVRMPSARPSGAASCAAGRARVI